MNKNCKKCGHPKTENYQHSHLITYCKCKRLEALHELQIESENMGLYNKGEIKVLDKGFVRLVDSMGDDASIVQMARVSYGEGTKKVSDDENLIRYLLRNKHTSPFEGVQFKFHVKLPIFVSNQWVRHRMWSYNQISGRYSEMPDEFYVPEENKVTTQNPDNKQGGTTEPISFRNAIGSYGLLDDRGIEPESWADIFESNQSDDRHFYEDYLKTGMRKELARINLPLSQYTEMYAVVDLHNLFHFLKLRQDKHAQYEIRVYADALLELIRPIVPIAVEAYEDYILNSVNFSQRELACFYELISNDLDHNGFTILDRAKSLITNKRELNEFLDKIRKILNG